MTPTSSPYGGLYLFLGPDRARKLERIQELARSLGVQPLDRHHLDASATTAPELLALCRQQPAASKRRLVVVDDAHKLAHPCVAALLEHAETIAHVACVILLVEIELSLRHPLARAFLQGGASAVVTERFPAREAPTAKPFALTDALGASDTAGALAAAHDQLAAGKEPLELLGLVAWQLNRWVVVKRLCERGYAAERIERATGMKAWQVQRVQSEVARRSLASLRNLLERCWQLDVEAKSGRTSPQLALEQLMVEACLPSGAG